jgi:hypothetical protein
MCFHPVAYSTSDASSFHHVKHNLSLMSSNSSRKRLKCLGENLVLGSQYISCRFVSQSMKATTKSQMNVRRPCVNLDNPCTTFNKGKTQTKLSKVSASTKRRSLQALKVATYAQASHRHCTKAHN